jgi:hypothetical protein
MLAKFLRFFNDPITNLFKVIFIVAILAVVTVFVSTATSTQDWEWYQSGFSELPNRIVIYNEGTRTELQAGDPGFDQLAEAIRASLDSGVRVNSRTGVSETTLNEAYSRYLTLEVFYPHPVKLHAWFYTGQPTQMLFPITGRHSDWPIVFMGNDGDYLSDGPVLKTKDPILQVMRDLGYLN